MQVPVDTEVDKVVMVVDKVGMAVNKVADSVADVVKVDKPATPAVVTATCLVSHSLKCLLNTH